MASLLDKGTASKLQNSLQATPGVSGEQAQAFAGVLAAIQKPGVTEADAERQVRQWAAKAPRHAVAVVQSAALGSSYMRTLPSNSWIVRALTTSKK